MPEITNSDALYAYDLVKTICWEVGPGLSGGSQEREWADLIKRELESHLGVGNVVVEEFTFTSGALAPNRKRSFGTHSLGVAMNRALNKI